MLPVIVAGQSSSLSMDIIHEQLRLDERSPDLKSKSPGYVTPDDLFSALTVRIRYLQSPQICYWVFHGLSDMLLLVFLNEFSSLPLLSALAVKPIMVCSQTTVSTSVSFLFSALELSNLNRQRMRNLERLMKPSLSMSISSMTRLSSCSREEHPSAIKTSLSAALSTCIAVLGCRKCAMEAGCALSPRQHCRDYWQLHLSNIDFPSSVSASIALNLRCLESNIFRCEVEIDTEIGKFFVDNQRRPFAMKLSSCCLESNILRCEVEIGSEIGKLFIDNQRSLRREVELVLPGVQYPSFGPFVVKLNLYCLESNILRCEVEIGSEIGKCLLTTSGPFVVKLNLRCLESNILRCEVEIDSEIEKLFIDNQRSLRREVELVLSWIQDPSLRS
ncbi:hypothetical protein F3Y22_tig00111330pilonHSYRG01016 [Hibiscus syriacus]|uniref:Uncharacterized protein n=1 Tax=Hibiscus syriacus TaxID=106335 RepID=A0A6A2YQ69_HIBSY|nr:hypothetical protein F3Y22_tig00111330pilonHSYRG01016 [Hibiscus syriacus]